MPRACLRLIGIATWTLMLLIPLGVPVLLVRIFSPAASLRLGAAAARIWSRGLLRIGGVWRSTAGPPPPPGAFVACTHHGYLDIPVLLASYPTTFIAKREIAGWPVLGPLARLAGTLWVDRNRRSDTLRLHRRLLPLLRRGLSVTIFPEGGAGSGAQVRPFKPPLFEAAAELATPCVPAALSYRTPGAGADDAGPGQGSPHRTVCWCNDEPLPAHLWRLLHLPRIEARLRFGAPVLPQGDRKALAAELQRRVAEIFEPIPQPRQEDPRATGAGDRDSSSGAADRDPASGDGGGRDAGSDARAAAGAA